MTAKKTAEKIAKDKIDVLNHQVKTMNDKLEVASTYEEQLELLQRTNKSNVSQISQLKEDVKKVSSEKEGLSKKSEVSKDSYSRQILDLKQKVKEAEKAIKDSVDEVSQLKTVNEMIIKENEEELVRQKALLKEEKQRA